MKSMGVEVVFSLPGGPMGDVAQAILDLGIKLINVRHEQAAAMMAHAYSRVSGRPGVCMAGSGADTLNLLTGIANAYMDPSPVVAICGSASERTYAMLAFQDVNQLDVMKPVVKQAWQVPLTEKIPTFVEMAFRYALSGKPGPVYLDFPANIINTKVEESKVEARISLPVKHRPMGDWELVRKAIKILATSERPIILAGNGVLWSDASAELQEFVNVTSIPFYTTPLARGVIPEDHQLCFSGARRVAWREADAILVLGTRASFIVSYLLPPGVAAQAQIIEVNIEAEEIGHNRPVDVGIQGDVKAVLKQLTEEARKNFAARNELPWLDRLREVDKARHATVSPMQHSDQKPIHPLRLCKEVADVLPRDTIVVEDGQETLIFARQTIPIYYPGHQLDLGPSGCIGVGIPFGVGAKVAKPDKPVVVVTGDSAFGFHAMEMDTAIRYNLALVVVVSNNGGVAADAMKVPGRELGFTRYDKLVEALGGWGKFVEEPEDIAVALKQAFSAGKPALVNVMVDPSVAATTQMFSADVRGPGRGLARFGF